MFKLFRRKGLTAVLLVAVTIGMVGLSFAAVPLYRLFCQVTGYGGTTQVAEEAPAVIAERVITIHFNADVGQGLPWRFKPKQRAIEVRPGETHLAFYEAENLSAEPILGSSTFNVTPQKAGIYFNKIQCFCFEEQFLEAGESAEFGVTFFIDPEIVTDRDMHDLDTITLSYTFFNLGEAARDAYIEDRSRLASREAGEPVN